MQEASINETGQKPHKPETSPGLHNHFPKPPVQDEAGLPNATQMKSHSQNPTSRATSRLTDTGYTTFNVFKTDLQPSDTSTCNEKKKQSAVPGR